MKKKLFFIFLAIISFLSLPHPTLAFDRNALFNNIRSTINTNYSYTGINIALNAGPVMVGSSNHSLPAYTQIAQITAQIQALKLQIKNIPPM